MVVLIACRGDREVSPKDRIVGSWKITSFVVTPSYPGQIGTYDEVARLLQQGNDCPTKTEFLFFENKSMYTRYQPECKASLNELGYVPGIGRINYGWSVQNDTLLLRSPAEYITIPYKLKLEDTTMTLVLRIQSQTDGIIRFYTSVFKRS